MNTTSEVKESKFNYVKAGFWLTLGSLIGTVIGIFIAYFAWQNPKPAPALLNLAPSPSPMILSIAMGTPLPTPKPESELFKMTEEEIEAETRKYERKFELSKILNDKGENKWIDSGIIITRNRTLWLGSANAFSVQTEDGESELENDSDRYHTSFFVDDEGYEGDGFIIDTNSILGAKDFGTLKFKSLAPEDVFINIEITMDFDILRTQIPPKGGCPF